MLNERASGARRFLSPYLTYTRNSTHTHTAAAAAAAQQSQILHKESTQSLSIVCARRGLPSVCTGVLKGFSIIACACGCISARDRRCSTRGECANACAGVRQKEGWATPSQFYCLRALQIDRHNISREMLHAKHEDCTQIRPSRSRQVFVTRSQRAHTHEHNAACAVAHACDALLIISCLWCRACGKNTLIITHTRTRCAGVCTHTCSWSRIRMLRHAR